MPNHKQAGHWAGFSHDGEREIEDLALSGSSNDPLLVRQTNSSAARPKDTIDARGACKAETTSAARTEECLLPILGEVITCRLLLCRPAGRRATQSLYTLP